MFFVSSVCFNAWLVCPYFILVISVFLGAGFQGFFSWFALQTVT